MSNYEAYLARKASQFEAAKSHAGAVDADGTASVKAPGDGADLRGLLQDSDNRIIRDALAKLPDPMRNLLRESDGAPAENLSPQFILDVFRLVTRLAGAPGAASEKASIDEEVERRLVALREAFAKLASRSCGDTDVFATSLMQQLETLASAATAAAQQGVLTVASPHLISAQHILDAFAGGERVLRYVWRVDPAQRLFADPNWRRQFELTAALADAHEIRQVRALLLAPRRRDLEAPHLHKLLEFMAGQTGYTAKIGLVADYATLAAQNGMPAEPGDLMLFGDRLMHQAKAPALSLWSRDARSIQRCIAFFDSLWDAKTLAAANPASAEPGVSLAELMACDEDAVAAA